MNSTSLKPLISLPGSRRILQPAKMPRHQEHIKQTKQTEHTKYNSSFSNLQCSSFNPSFNTRIRNRKCIRLDEWNLWEYDNVNGHSHEDMAEDLLQVGRLPNKDVIWAVIRDLNSRSDEQHDSGFDGFFFPLYMLTKPAFSTD
jgi:hypothetical protein